MKMILLSVMFVAVITLVPLQQNQPVIVRDNRLLGYVGDCCGQDQSIAVDPTDPNRIVVAAGSYYWYSGDGGLTWNRGDLFDLGVGGGDPVLAFDSQGNVYWSSVIGSLGDTGMAVFKSTTGGSTWTMVQLTNRTDPTKWLNDKEWIAVDTSQSRFHGRIYVVWDVFVNGSWNEPHNNIVGSSFGGVYLSYSDDFGTTFSRPTKLPLSFEMYSLQLAVGPAGQVYLVGSIPHRGLNFMKSVDGGKSFDNPRKISNLWDLPNPLSNTKVRTGNYPFDSLAVDQRTGNIYVAWVDAENADGNVVLSKSTDNGNSWSSAIRVNDDTAGSHRDQLMPSVTVSPDGVVHVAWVDRRNDLNNIAYDIYYAKSDDSGKIFSKNLKISSNSSDPTQLHDPTFIGDYLGIAAGNDGALHVTWGGVGPNSQQGGGRAGTPRTGLAIFEATIIYAPNIHTASVNTTSEISSTTISLRHSAASTLMMPQPPISQIDSNLAYTVAAVLGVLVLAASAVMFRKRAKSA